MLIMLISWDCVVAGVSSEFIQALSPDQISAITPAAIRLLSPEVIQVSVLCLSGRHKPPSNKSP